MTVQSTKNIIQHNAVEGQDTYQYDFLVLQDEHMYVYLNGIPYEGGYQVLGLGNQDGGEVILDTPIGEGDVGKRLTLVRIIDATQELDYTSYDGFPAESHERGLDKLTMLVQQNKTTLDGSIHIPDSEDPNVTNTELPNIENRAERLLYFDVEGNVTTYRPNADAPSVLRVDIQDGQGGSDSRNLLSSETVSGGPQFPKIGFRNINQPNGPVQLNSQGKIPPGLVDILGLSIRGPYRGDDLCHKPGDLGEENVNNWNFELGLLGWLSQDADLQIVTDNTLRITNNVAAVGRAYQQFGTIIGHTYRAEFDIELGLSPEVQIAIDRNGGTSIDDINLLVTDSGKYVLEYVATNVTTTIITANLTGVDSQYTDVNSMSNKHVVKECEYPDYRNPSERFPEIQIAFSTGDAFVITMAEGEESGHINLFEKIGDSSTSVLEVKLRDAIIFLEEINDPADPGITLVYEGWYLIEKLIDVGDASYISYDDEGNVYVIGNNVQTALDSVDDHLIEKDGWFSNQRDAFRTGIKSDDANQIILSGFFSLDAGSFNIPLPQYNYAIFCTRIDAEQIGVTQLAVEQSDDGYLYSRSFFDGSWSEWKLGGDGVADHNELINRNLPDQHSVSAISDIDTEYFHQSTFLDKSTGGANAGSPIKLDSNGFIDDSMVNFSLLEFQGQFTPTAETEYPSTIDLAFGAVWRIFGVDDALGYTYTTGDLNGQTVYNGDFIMYGRSSWALVNVEIDVDDYYRVDGTVGLIAPLAAAGQQLKNVGNGTDTQDAVTVAQLNGRILRSGDTMSGHLSGITPTSGAHLTRKDYVDSAVVSASFPAGTRMVFVQSAAPTGWLQDTSDAANNRMMQVVNTGGGGGIAGSDSPIFNDKVPSHNHAAGTLAAASSGAHTHQINRGYNAHNNCSASSGATYASQGCGWQDGNIGSSGAHTHTVSGTTAVNAESGAWNPRYVAVMVAVKQ